MAWDHCEWKRDAVRVPGPINPHHHHKHIKWKETQNFIDWSSETLWQAVIGGWPAPIPISSSVLLVILGANFFLLTPSIWLFTSALYTVSMHYKPVLKMGCQVDLREKCFEQQFSLIFDFQAVRHQGSVHYWLSRAVQTAFLPAEYRETHCPFLCT